MDKRRQLKVVRPHDQKLGRATIMDRALAQRYGSTYVHLAAFAIDVDRVREQEQEPSALPFAWEVYLTEAQLGVLVETARHDPTPMIEETCLGILEQPRSKREGAGPLGSQLPFAIYTAVARGILPARLGQCFASWTKPPVDLIEDVERLAKAEGMLARLVDHCLDARIEPPLIEPVRSALVALLESPPSSDE